MRQRKSFTFIIVLGLGINMATATDYTQAILDHAKKYLSLSEENLAVKETPISALPPEMQVYYLEKKGSYGNVYYHYVVLNEELFCSADGDGFERLLRKERYLENKNLTVDQVIILFRLLKLPMRDTRVVTAEDLASARLKQYAGKIAVPKIDESKNGVQIVFWVSSLVYPPEKWILTIDPEYNVRYQRESD